MYSLLKTKDKQLSIVNKSKYLGDIEGYRAISYISLEIEKQKNKQYD